MAVHWFDQQTLDKVIRAKIRRVDVVLDVGCGIFPQTFFRPRLRLLCEPYGEYVQTLRARFPDDPTVVILQGTWQEVLRLLPDRSVDSVFLRDLIEHLEKEDGRKLLQECERVARRQILVFTPLGFMPQDCAPGEVDVWGLGGGNWQVHRSGWTPEDFDDTWEIWASRDYHKVDGKGRVLDRPFGAFWAIRDAGRDLTALERIRRAPGRMARRTGGFLERHTPRALYLFLRSIWLKLAGR